jgi:hypothetical protein
VAKAKAPAALSKKAGGLPTWAWIPIIGGVGYVGYKLYEDYKANAAASGTTTGASTTPLTTATGTTTTSTTTTQETLAAWKAGALAAIAKIGGGKYLSPSQALAALNAYLAGRPVSQKAANAINRALVTTGLPPLGTVPPIIVEASTPGTTTSPSTNTHVSSTPRPAPRAPRPRVSVATLRARAAARTRALRERAASVTAANQRRAGLIRGAQNAPRAARALAAPQRVAVTSTKRR